MPSIQYAIEIEIKEVPISSKPTPDGVGGRELIFFTTLGEILSREMSQASIELVQPSFRRGSDIFSTIVVVFADSLNALATAIGIWQSPGFVKSKVEQALFAQYGDRLTPDRLDIQINNVSFGSSHHNNTIRRIASTVNRYRPIIDISLFLIFFILVFLYIHGSRSFGCLHDNISAIDDDVKDDAITIIIPRSVTYPASLKSNSEVGLVIEFEDGATFEHSEGKSDER